LGKKIREAEIEKVPVLFIVGPKDESASTISVRVDGKEDKVGLPDLDSWLRERR
jgi:threonyl-tRNA synthetase